MNGKIIKGIGGFYYIKTEEGLIECKARGKFRHKDIKPMVGDNVTIKIENGNIWYNGSFYINDDFCSSNDTISLGKKTAKC